MSENFGGKFFSMNDAKLIGYIREAIDIGNIELTDKERCILIASLLYSADKSANTVGHYDAYIKGHEIKDSFEFELISPYENNDTEIVISREDANLLSKRLKCDIVYIDPPYNSRQYSRFYHILENIACWKKPELYGVALKPSPENMSEYCKSKAKVYFKDLIESLDCKYIVVSYNNTYNSKSNSSKNKMNLKDIENALSSRGTVQKFEIHHNFFNAGKTDFKDHKELIFIVKVE
jgi:adenine-specific DNA-methyltransferase